MDNKFGADAVIAGVPLNAMGALRGAAHDAAKNSNVELTQRRYYIDGHTGYSYHHNEFNILIKNPQSPLMNDEEIVAFCKEQAKAASDGKIRIYAIWEIFGEITMDELMDLPEEDREQHYRMVWYKPEWEPLEMFKHMEV